MNSIQYSEEVLSQFYSLSTREYLALINEIIRNDSIQDGTAASFQVFNRIMKCSICNKEFTNNYKELNTVSRCIKRLKEVRKFDASIFGDYLVKEYETVPLQVIGWLIKENIMFLTQFHNQLKYRDVAAELLELLDPQTQDKLFSSTEIMKHYLLEIIRDSFILQISHYRLETCRFWSKYCSRILNDLADKTIRMLLNKTPPLNFQNYLLLIPSLARFISSKMLNRIYKNVLQKFMTYNEEQFDIYSCYIYQQLWCSKRINNTLLVTYDSIFSKYCTFQDILDIMEDNKNINWKYTLIAVGVSAANSKHNCKLLRTYAEDVIKAALKCGATEKFIKGILVVRQGIMEEEMDIDYKKWYSIMFGKIGKFKPTKTTFKYLMQTLTTLIPFEQKFYLTIHIEVPVNSPPQHNSIIYDYIKLSKARLKELTKSPTISMNGFEIHVLYMFEECVRNNTIDQILNNIKDTRFEDYSKIIVPQLKRRSMLYTKVKLLINKPDSINIPMVTAKDTNTN